MTNILAIDPGPTESGYALIDASDCCPLEVGKLDNDELLGRLWLWPAWRFSRSAIEMIASYGMPVGADVFQTCVWVGRFYEAIDGSRPSPSPPALITRHTVKMHHCHSTAAKDGNISQALVDRFASGQRNHGKGTKAAPGWFYGFAGDMWQAYALAVYIADTQPDLGDAQRELAETF